MIGKCGAVLIGLVLLAACGGGGAAGDGVKQVTLLLDFAIDGLHAPFIVAADNGCFRDQGLDVRIQPGQGSATTVRVVGAGEAEFGVAGAGAVLQGVQSDLPVRVVSMLLDKTPAVVVALKESAITEPSDLKGKTYGDAQQASTGVLFPAFLRANQLSEQDVRFVGMTFSARVPSLQSGEVDTIGGYIQEFVNIQDQVTFIPWVEHGIGSYGSTVIANTTAIEQDPDTVRAFVAGTKCGFDAMQADPQAAAEVVAKRAQGEPAYFAGELALLAEYWSGGNDGFGRMTEQRWRETQELLVSVGSLTSPLPAAKVWTNDYLP